ncbi:MAG: Asp-tRNA(Asn)/Glu-tRNA(Gln) amidotransferase subunit GatA [Gammaproteobacteria bacterium]|nr:Asp-tRNA(Asn)/Glu-tRNA(Gln) amidotransferase subunit GatA [Gammaproteobacteria bacterium]NIM73679.1 Asp-tRNA(Asn)/Glu-tRNA(Gln) amidotransferase subunit GatA [Gammaproteobacteria bacterium]NIN37353.1 Asp-tRNA(Asn)/Glu-tRNA(Gln) amidotransferase subunit GatA [Gammaproteobacteria bacterium]NIO25512.1 Asp-tRNA(Asn)/Glu-tRNA(Gln) amidotransferase subunit GatA [Gammaproteobacteria bacterium]NIO66187.1 Asp-tRNA(Asn)/Glu-tRNA(Gln) amidotransferase subunit GatA [Gammaproteobacteria bacterium]
MHDKSVAELQRGLRSRAFSSVELVEACLARIEALDARLNSLISVTGERALAQARAADARLANGSAGPLTGIPLLHKDIFCTRGVRTSCGSRMLDNFVAPYDATAVERLDAAGLCMLGKTNMDEFAMGSSTEASFYGPTRNPWDPQRVPGGSSGGSAAAVAARLAPLATGTDTGGSIRQPAALCGVTGIKPTYGRVSRFGMVAFASSLDQGGAMARSAEDAAWLLAAMAGFDARDSTSIDRPVEEYPAMLAEPLSGLRIGLPREYFDEGLDGQVGTCVEQAIRELERLGAIIGDVSLPHASLSVPVYYVVAPAECSSNLSRYDGVRYGYRAEGATDLLDMYKRSRSEGFGTEVKRRIMVGTYVLSAGYYDAYYLKAQQLRRRISDDFQKAFETFDVLAGPTTPHVAFPIGEKSDDPIAMYLCDVYTTGVNLAGLPAASVPAGFAQALPVGLHLIGNYFEEARLLNVAHQYQQVSDWHARIPPGMG